MFDNEFESFYDNQNKTTPWINLVENYPIKSELFKTHVQITPLSTPGNCQYISDTYKSDLVFAKFSWRQWAAWQPLSKCGCGFYYLASLFALPWMSFDKLKWTLVCIQFFSHLSLELISPDLPNVWQLVSLKRIN